MFQIEARRTATDPAERARRLALLFAIFEDTSANGETREDDPLAEAEANQLIKAGELVNDSSKRRVVKTTEVQQ